jgi:hypothetical protein
MKLDSKASVGHRSHRMLELVLFAMFLCALVPHWSRGEDPLDTVRNFCRLDGVGDRLHPITWARVAPLVDWTLEPAWDRVVLITGYEILGPRADERSSSILVDVRYTVKSVVAADGIDNEPRIETVTYRLVSADGLSWKIAGPPPPPHVFDSRADAEEMAASLRGERGDFLSSSGFLWRAVIGQGNDVPFRVVTRVMDEWPTVEVREPRAGDVVVYYDPNDQPYHAGLVEEGGTVLSATLNRGIQRAPLDAFAGRQRYWHFPVRSPSNGEDDGSASGSGEEQSANQSTEKPTESASPQGNDRGASATPSAQER